jgi:hypothetical protein
MTLESAVFLATFSFSHVFFPGHPTPLLLATGGMGMKKAWQFTLGMAIAHGLLMALALGVGQFFLKMLMAAWPGGKFWVSHVDIPILLVLGCLLLREAFRKGGEVERAEKILDPKRPFLTGAAIGFIPCPDTIGYAMIGGAIGMNGLAHTVMATSIVFIGTALGFCSVTAVASFMPKLVKSPKLGPAICLVTALICFANVTWRTWNTWNDWA